jgi:hypothetical protein
VAFKKRVRIIKKYGAMNRKDWRKISVKDIKTKSDELERFLVPLLHKSFVEEIGTPSRCAKRIATECRKGLGIVLPLSRHTSVSSSTCCSTTET